jgi:hypothetical protein
MPYWVERSNMGLFNPHGFKSQHASVVDNKCSNQSRTRAIAVECRRSGAGIICGCEYDQTSRSSREWHFANCGQRARNQTCLGSRRCRIHRRERRRPRGPIAQAPKAEAAQVIRSTRHAGEIGNVRTTAVADFRVVESSPYNRWMQFGKTNRVLDKAPSARAAREGSRCDHCGRMSHAPQTRAISCAISKDMYYL